MPKMSRGEGFAIAILSGVFVMFLTNSFHGIPDAAVCLSAVFLFFLFGVLEAKEFNTGVNWDLVVFIGMAIGLGTIFTSTGISDWLAGIIVPALAPIASNPWTFMFGIMAIMFVWRFIDVAIFIPTMAIIIPILPEIQERYNIHPLVWIPIFTLAANAFFMNYQNIWAMMSKSVSGDRAWSNKHLASYGILYFSACFLSLIAAIPMWISMGMF